MNKYKIMVDMDQTLIDAISTVDPRYEYSNGEVVKYTLHQIGKLGEIISNEYIIKVSIRPYAIEMVRSIIDNNYVYIIWSAGMYDYVHAIMKYFISVSGIEPTYIYTKNDMINVDGYIYKSMLSRGYDIDDILIIEDNRNFVYQEERNRVIDVSPWYAGNINDGELKHVIQLLYLYNEHVPYQKPHIPMSFYLGPV